MFAKDNKTGFARKAENDPTIVVNITSLYNCVIMFTILFQIWVACTIWSS